MGMDRFEGVGVTVGLTGVLRVSFEARRGGLNISGMGGETPARLS